MHVYFVQHEWNAIWKPVNEQATKTGQESVFSFKCISIKTGCYFTIDAAADDERKPKVMALYEDWQTAGF